MVVDSSMRGDPVPDPDHFLRYIKPTCVDEDDATGQLIILGSGFLARPSDNNAPSVNWLEVFEGTTAERVSEVRSRARMEYAKNARLARLNVGTVRQCVLENSEDGRNILVLQDPLDANGGMAEDPSHALMRDIPSEDDAEGELIGDLISGCVIEHFAARPAV